MQMPWDSRELEREDLPGTPGNLFGGYTVNMSVHASASMGVS